MVNWSQESVLVTGGTGSFGKKFTEIMLRDYHPRRLVIFSRDELKQHEMRESGFNHPSLRYFIGDVRDVDRLKRALASVTIVIHAAALKQVPACEYNPFEAIQTNIMGGRNVIDAAIDAGVRRILALSTDKAVNPINLYGATKLCAEKMFVQANAYAGSQETRFACARYGNVVGSRGSVIPIFLEQRKRGKITITDARMTRFWLTLDQGVKFVIRCVDQMLHEVLVSDDESRNTLETDEMFIIQPAHSWWKSENWVHARKLPEGFRYSSDTNEQWLTRRELENLVAPEARAAEAITA